MPYYTNKMKQHIMQVFQHIREAIYVPIKKLETTSWVTKEPVPFDARETGERKNLQIGDSWGELWDCGWFHFTGEVSLKAKNKKVVLLIDVNGEGCVFDGAGCPIRGLTNISSSFDYTLGKPGKRVVQFLESAQGGELVDIWVETGCNDLFGRYSKNGTLEEAHIAICNEELRQLYYDFEVLISLGKSIPEDEARYQGILFALYEASNQMRDYTEEEAKKAREIVGKELVKKGGDPSLKISAIGHAHIDLAWLWPIRETIRKGARSFSTVLDLMDRYPDYIFGASQPQLYQWIKEQYPLLYEKIRKRIEEGRWEVQGGMWVEADTNISGGESLIRQILYGKRFFRDEFQKDMKSLWLPDVFGYSGALPQILKKSGIDYFMTIKLSWNEYNQFPHHTFFWEGIDGSRVLAHMPPEGTYNSAASPEAIKKAEKNYLDKGVSDRCLMLFGIGDGGGGPGAEHLERLKRMKNLNGIAPVGQEHSVEFFQYIEKDENKYKTWKGELYLEKHQGTYTTQAKNKWFNRKLELILRELEYGATLGMIYADMEYPQEQIESIWKEVLLYQFHDILPGSSIKRVYDESTERYSSLYDQVQEMIEKTYQELSNRIETKNKKIPFLLSNSLSWKQVQWIKVESQWLYVQVPPMGYTVIDLAHVTKSEFNIHGQKNQIENEYFLVRFDQEGQIQSIYDKQHDFEVLDQSNPGNRLSVYQDEGDAWDFPIGYDERPVDRFQLERAEVSTDGPKVMMKQTYSYNQSKLIQEITLTADSRRIDFSTKVDWQEEGKMLRTSFLVNIMTDEAVCDIQFGSIKRPTHRNTSWDMGKYEVCAHKWVDLSQKNYGVALINDCKYGYKVKENILDLNLLRSTNYPGQQADVGTHKFVYSLYPHKGDHIEGKVSQAAYELNNPLFLNKIRPNEGILPETSSLLEIEEENIVIESVKKAERGSQVIIRLYENAGQSVSTKISFTPNITSIETVDLMEENPVSIDVERNTFILDFKPFEIHTLQIELDNKKLLKGKED